MQVLEDHKLKQRCAVNILEPPTDHLVSLLGPWCNLMSLLYFILFLVSGEEFIYVSNSSLTSHNMKIEV